MIKVKRFSLVLLLGTGGLALFSLGSWLLAPKYQGKTAQAWFKEMENGGGLSAREQNAMHALVAMGDRAAPYLANEYTRQDSVWKQSLGRWLRQRGWAFIPSEDGRSIQAYITLMGIGSNGKGAVPAIVKAARNKTHRRRAGAIQLLGAIHREPKLAVPVLIDCLKEQEGYVRTFAAAALGEFGSEGRPAVPALLQALEGQDVYLAVAAASALIKIDPTVDFVWPLLIKELQSSIATHRVEAARALGNLGLRAQEAMPLLRKGLDDQDHRVRQAAALALQQIASQSGGNSSER